MLLLGLVCLAVAWLGGSAAVHVYNYSIYSEAAVSESMEWSIVQVGKDQYQIEGHYRFTVDGTAHDGISLLTETTYRNPWAADHRLQTLDGQGPWRVWHVKGDPARSTLQKSFPLKECVSAAVLFVLLLYFAGLGYYVARSGQQPTQQPENSGKRNGREDSPKE